MISKLKFSLSVIVIIVIFFVFDSNAQEDCNYWNAGVGVKSSNSKRGRKDEKNPENIIEGIECLLKLEGDKSRGAFGGATSPRGEFFLKGEADSTVEICALYYISVLFYEKYDHARAVVLRYKNYEENKSLNSNEAVKTAFESYRKWFAKVREIGLEEARKQKLDPLKDSDVLWY